MKICCENWKNERICSSKSYSTNEEGVIFVLRGEGRQAGSVGDEERRMRYKIEAKEWGTIFLSNQLFKPI